MEGAAQAGVRRARGLAAGAMPPCRTDARLVHRAVPVACLPAAQPSSAANHTRTGKRAIEDRRPGAVVGRADVQFHVLSFEGPDAYAAADGIASRIWGLSRALAHAGSPTHLWFVGDPDLPGHERRDGVELHRWCQWLSRYHRAGVYDGEHGKLEDYSRSLPPFLIEGGLLAHVRSGGRAVVLAEEWHTVHAVLHLDWLLRQAGARERVTILWNANNTFGFAAIDWRRLARAAVVTTVSRYMKHRMWPLGVDALVIPNGLDDDAFQPIDAALAADFRRRVAGRTVLAKVARFDPDKRWLAAVDIVAELKRRGRGPLLVARGGIEAHGHEVREQARRQRLTVLDVEARAGGPGLVETLEGGGAADVLLLRSPLDAAARALLFAQADAVLANSGHEPFGLVGLEAMAAGGIACTGCSGEDYAEPGRNAIVLQTASPDECVHALCELTPARARALRRAGVVTAREYHWGKILMRRLEPWLVLRGAAWPALAPSS